MKYLNIALRLAAMIGGLTFVVAFWLTLWPILPA